MSLSQFIASPVSSRLAVTTALLWSVCCTAVSAPVTIEYELSSLGGAQYEYRYTVTNLSQAAPVAWFSVDFDTALYDESSLQISSVGTGDWDELILASFLGVPAQYDAYYVGANPIAIGESAAGFAVRFTWLGQGTPDSQRFTIWDVGTADAVLVDVTVASSQPPIGMPEPASGALAGAALAAAGLSRRLRRSASA